LEFVDSVVPFSSDDEEERGGGGGEAEEEEDSDAKLHYKTVHNEKDYQRVLNSPYGRGVHWRALGDMVYEMLEQESTWNGNDNGVTLVNFATFEYLSKSVMFPHKYT
jgi:hypothetical protein